MAFMMKKKKYKFQVDLCVEELLEVPFVSAVLFAKVRLLDGGNFQEHSSRQEVKEHTVKWGAKFEFPCKMAANASTGVLEPCVLRVSVRKECKGGRSFQKLGFCDLNLAEFAGSGLITRRCLLEGYDARRRQDNSMLRVAIKMNMLSGDILFKVPSPSVKHKPVQTATAPEEATVVDPRIRDDFSSGSLAGSIASGSSGFGSLPKKRTPLFNSELLSGHCNMTADTLVIANDLQTSQSMLDSVASTNAGCAGEHEECPATATEPGHSRNSSSTSQMSRASGYSSINSHSQHSRQSSSGDSGHIRNPSSGSLALSETGSLDRAKAALERRKKAQAQETEMGQVSGRVEVTRVNPDNLIAELLKNTNLEQSDESAETSGLQLFIAKDGTAALGNHEVKSQMSTGAQLFKQVVMEDNR